MSCSSRRRRSPPACSSGGYFLNSIESGQEPKVVDTFRQFWFLYVLMACQIAPLTLASRPRFLTTAALVAPSLAAAMPQGGLVEGFLHTFPFFVAAILLAERRYPWVPGGDTICLAAAALGFTAAIPLSGALDGLDFYAAAALPAAACCILLTVSLARLPRGQALAANASLTTG